MDVNVLAALAWTRRAVAAGLGRGRPGAVVNIASVAGLGPAPGHRLLRGEQGGTDRADDAARGRAQPRRAGQRGRAGGGEDAVRGSAVRGRRGRSCRRATRWGVSANRRTSPRRWRSSPPPTHPGSPARPSWSTAALSLRSQPLGVARESVAGAIAADELAVALARQPAAVVHQEAAGAGELVALLGQHPDRQFFTGQAGQVGAGQLQRLGQLGLVDVDRRRTAPRRGGPSTPRSSPRSDRRLLRDAARRSRSPSCLSTPLWGRPPLRLQLLLRPCNASATEFVPRSARFLLTHLRCVENGAERQPRKGTASDERLDPGRAGRFGECRRIGWRRSRQRTSPIERASASESWAQRAWSLRRSAAEQGGP